MSAKYTPGPLIVKVDDKWPFRINTFDASGEIVFCRDMPSYSTRQETAQQAMSGAYMGKHAVDAVILNELAFADEVLRASAPELLEALKELEAKPEHTGSWLKARAAIAKATGGTA